MADQILELLRIVRDGIYLYHDLLEHERRKTALLTQGRVDAILESNKIDEEFDSQLRALQSEMSRLCQDLSTAFRIPREELTLVRVTQHLDPSLSGLERTLIRKISLGRWAARAEAREPICILKLSGTVALLIQWKNQISLLRFREGKIRKQAFDAWYGKRCLM